MRLHGCQFSRAQADRMRGKIPEVQGPPRDSERPEWGPSPADIAGPGHGPDARLQ